LLPLILIGISFLIIRHKAKNITDNYNILVQRYDGEIKPAGFFGYPVLNLVHQNFKVAVRSVYGGKNRPPYTHFEIKNVKSINYKVVIYRESFFGKVGKILGMQDIQINNPIFDEAFVIKSDSEMRLRNLLTPEFQQLLMAIKDHNPELRIENSEMRLSIPSIPNDPSTYELHIECLLHAAGRC